MPDSGQRFVGFSSKAYFGRERSLQWMRTVRTGLDERLGRLRADVVPFMIPAFPLLVEAVEIFAGSPMWVGAQTVSAFDGPSTGGVSASLLAEIGVRLVEIAHSERRSVFKETDDDFRRHVDAASGAGLTTLLCVGEDAQSTDAAEQCARQIADIGCGQQNMLIAYEPVWAIGADEPAPVKYANDVARSIRDDFGLPVLYGGAAGPGLLSRLTEYDGIFLGRRAHDPMKFLAVVDEAESS